MPDKGSECVLAVDIGGTNARFGVISVHGELIGEMSAFPVPFDADGRAIDSEVNNRVIGISLEDLKKIDHVVGVTGGPEKINAIRAALKGKIINVLITDHVSAKKVLEE